MPKLHRRQKNVDGTMPLVEHLRELRRRLLISCLAIGLTTIIGFWWYEHGLFGVPTLGEMLKGPYCELPPSARASLAADGECRLLATSVFEMFMLRLKVGALAGLVIACPIWLWQLWRFVTPGLKKTERRWTITFVTLAALLFIAGAVIAYLMLPLGLGMLLTLGDSTQIAALTGHDYFSFVFVMLLVFGVSFELPLFTAMLNLAGVITYDQIKDKRRILVVIVFIFAAVATPTQDPISMTILAIALLLLMEVAIQFTRIHDRHVAKNRPDWADDDDQSAAPIARPAPLDSSGIDADSAAHSSAVGRSEPHGAPIRATTIEKPRPLADNNGFDDIL